MATPHVTLPAAFTVDFAEASFQLTDTTHIGGEEYLHSKLEMVFPDGSILIFKQSEIPNPEGTTGNLGNDSSAVLMSLEENQMSLRKFAASCRTIKMDHIYATESYMLNGESIFFNYDAFPSGVYRVKYTLTTDQGDFYGEQTIFNSVVVDACIREATDELISLGCDNDECNDCSGKVGKVYEMIVMKEGANLSFLQGDFNKASLKLRAAEKICINGSTCLKGCNDE